MARGKQVGASLTVWLYGVPVATLTEPSLYRYRLTFTEEALDTFGVGTRVLSLSLPIADIPVEDHRTDPRRRVVSAFLEGLLPEGNLRAQLAATLGVLSIDKRALLAQVGAECAGAVQFLAEGHTSREGWVRPLSHNEVDRIVEDLPTYHLPEGSAPMASLAGIQEKVVLTRLDGDRWGWPEQGAASSHLVKPEPSGNQALPQLIDAEHWAMTVANAAGLRAAQTELDSFGGRRALVVRRYDRDSAGNRTHQEDFCQALGLDPQAKYESPGEGVSRLSRIIALAAPRSPDPEALRRGLLSAVTFNVIIGNGDAHSKNYSILLGERGQVSLAPLYDVAPVMIMDRRFKNTGHVVNGRSNIDWVEVEDLVAEAETWGMNPDRARAVVTDTIERTWNAVHEVPEPAGLPTLVSTLESLWNSRSWRLPRSSGRR